MIFCLNHFKKLAAVLPFKVYIESGPRYIENRDI